MKLVIEIFKNVAGVGICVLAICWIQYKLFELSKYFMPQPTEWAKLKTHSAYEFYKRNNGNKNDKVLKPNGQREEDNENYYANDYDKPPIGLFSSTWTHFSLLIKSILKRLRNNVS